jgi:hypothetical protein
MRADFIETFFFVRLHHSPPEIAIVGAVRGELLWVLEGRVQTVDRSDSR